MRGLHFSVFKVCFSFLFSSLFPSFSFPSPFLLSFSLPFLLPSSYLFFLLICFVSLPLGAASILADLKVSFGFLSFSLPSSFPSLLLPSFFSFTNLFCFFCFFPS